MVMMTLRKQLPIHLFL